MTQVGRLLESCFFEFDFPSYDQSVLVTRKKAPRVWLVLTGYHLGYILGLSDPIFYFFRNLEHLDAREVIHQIPDSYISIVTGSANRRLVLEAHNLINPFCVPVQPLHRFCLVQVSDQDTGISRICPGDQNPTGK